MSGLSWHSWDCLLPGFSYLFLTQDSQYESGESVNFIEKNDHPSHLQYNDQWKYDSRNLNGLYNYINQLTLGANTLLGKVLEDKVYPNHSMFKAKLF